MHHREGSAEPDALREATDRAIAHAGPFAGTVLVRAAGFEVCASVGLADRAKGIATARSTRFNTASITKLFTAVAICRLAADRGIDLAGPVLDLLPDLPFGGGREITIDHLLTHTSGLPEDVPDEAAATRDTPTRSEWLRPLRGVRLVFAPGSGWQYSNAGYAVLGAVIEAVTGTSYFDAMSRLVFEPAGMGATGFDDPDGALEGVAVPYAYAANGEAVPSEPVPRSEFGRGAPYGYACSTVDDLARLVDLVAEGRLVDASTSRAILHGRVPTGTGGRYAGRGAFTEHVGGIEVTTTSGAGPGISAWLDWAPSAGYLSVVLSNHPKPAAHAVGSSLRSLVLAAHGTPSS